MDLRLVPRCVAILYILCFAGLANKAAYLTASDMGEAQQQCKQVHHKIFKVLWGRCSLSAAELNDSVGQCTEERKNGGLSTNFLLPYFVIPTGVVSHNFSLFNLTFTYFGVILAFSIFAHDISLTCRREPVTYLQAQDLKIVGTCLRVLNHIRSRSSSYLSFTLIGFVFLFVGYLGIFTLFALLELLFHTITQPVRSSYMNVVVSLIAITVEAISLSLLFPLLKGKQFYTAECICECQYIPSYTKQSELWVLAIVLSTQTTYLLSVAFRNSNGRFLMGQPFFVPYEFLLTLQPSSPTLNVYRRMDHFNRELVEERSVLEIYEGSAEAVPREPQFSGDSAQPEEGQRGAEGTDSNASSPWGLVRLPRLLAPIAPGGASVLMVERYTTIERLKSHQHKLFTDGDICVICLDSFEVCNMVRTLICAHSFHQKCADSWLRRNKLCPICKHDFTEPLPDPSPNVYPPHTLPNDQGVALPPSLLHNIPSPFPSNTPESSSNGQSHPPNPLVPSSTSTSTTSTGAPSASGAHPSSSLMPPCNDSSSASGLMGNPSTSGVTGSPSTAPCNGPVPYRSPTPHDWMRQRDPRDEDPMDIPDVHIALPAPPGPSSMDEPEPSPSSNGILNREPELQERSRSHPIPSQSVPRADLRSPSTPAISASGCLL